MKHLNILVVCQYYYPEQFAVNDICESLVKEGHKVTILTGLPNYPKGEILDEYRWFKKRNEDINGVRVIRNSLIGRGNNNILLMLNYLSFAFVATLRVLFMKKEFDAIFVYQLSPITMTLPAIVYKALTKKKMLLYCFDLWPESIASGGLSVNGIIYKFVFKMSKWIYSKADKIAISSKMFAKYFDEVLEIKKDMEYLPAYAEKLFTYEEPVQKTDDKLNLVFAGNIGEMQSVETIIKAANELKKNKNIIWHIIGDGSKYKNCVDLASEFSLDETVLFYGHKPFNEMPNYYKMADAFLVTLSKNKFISYTLPNKVQSYMAVGKPIIGAIDGETNLVIQEASCGLCVEAEDYKGFSKIVLKLYNNKNIISEYSENSRKYYEKYFQKEMFITKLIDLLGKS